MVLRDRLVNQAASRYRASGRSAYYFARCKLRHDPFYSLLLVEGLVPAGARIVDLGCAQGLLAAWLSAAQQCYSTGVWDSACPAPGSVASYRGIDRNKSEIRRARQALGNCAEFIVGDIAGEPLSGATLIVLLDVLHYLDYEAQWKLLRLIRTALPMNGLLLVRVGDLAGGIRSRVSGCVDSLVLRLRGCGAGELHRRPLSEWLMLLDEVGFTVQGATCQSSLGYANFLLRAVPKRHLTANGNTQ
jgi:SAM-dependent methyltransferase